MPLNPLRAEPDTVVQSVASQTADLGVASLIPARSDTFVGIDHEIISIVSPLSAGSRRVVDSYK